MHDLQRIFVEHEVFKVAFDGVVQRNFSRFADKRHVGGSVFALAAEFVGQKKQLVQRCGASAKRGVAVDGVQNFLVDHIEGFHGDDTRNPLMQK